MKKTIRLVIAGLMLLPLLVFGVVGSANVQALGVSDGAKAAQGDDQPTNLFGAGSLFKDITNTALFVVGAISVLMIIYGGIRYVISGGDSAIITSAKNTVLYAVVGLVVALLAYALVNFVITRLT